MDGMGRHKLMARMGYMTHRFLDPEAACCSTMRGAASAAERCAVERSDEYLCIGGAYRKHMVESVSKRAPSGS